MSTEPASPTEQVVIGNYVLGNPIFAHSSFNFAHFSGKNIGEGTFGKVKLGTHILTNEKVASPSFIHLSLLYSTFSCPMNPHSLTSILKSQVAVKILEKSKIKEVADVERVAREIHILRMIRHPNIIQLYEVTSETADIN